MNATTPITRRTRSSANKVRDAATIHNVRATISNRNERWRLLIRPTIPALQPPWILFRKPDPSRPGSRSIPPIRGETSYFKL